jgi:putative transposase
LRACIDAADPKLSVVRQCELLGLSRSSYYYEPATESKENLSLMALIDREYTDHPFIGSRRMAKWLQGEGHAVNRKRVQRLMRLMGLEAVYPKPRLSANGTGHKVFPYLLRNVAIERVHQVWSTDITYIPMPLGFMYLTAVMDWHSRYVLSWRLSNTLDVGFCLEALEAALEQGRPEIFNTDQGVQYTSSVFTSRLESAGAAVSMDGKGRCLDNVFVERLWRSVKYEEVYIWRHETVPALQSGLERYFGYYNGKRRHQSLENRTPAEVYAAGLKAKPRRR